MAAPDLKKSIEECSDALAKGLRYLASSLASVMAEEEAKKPNQLLAKDAQKERYEKQINSELNTFATRVEHGALLVMQKMMEMSARDKEMFSESVVNDFAKLVGLTQIIGTKPEDFLEQLDQGKTLFEIVQASDETFEKMYQAAKELYAKEHFEQSVDAFGFLTLINAKSYGCWLGLGNSQFFLKRYVEALFTYGWCCQVDPAEPTCHIFSSRCYEEIQELDNAINAIDLALLVIADNSEYLELKLQLIDEKQRLVNKQKR